MYKEIVLSAFAKARSETPATTKTQWAEYLTDCLWEDFRYQISRRTLLNYYNHYTQGDTTDDVTPKAKTIELLCNYLKYPSYADYILHHRQLENKRSQRGSSATYIVEGDAHRDVVTIHIEREFLSKDRNSILRIA